MTEAEWFACRDPELMLKFLRGRASQRKFRLFALALCRQYWHLYRGARMRAARVALRTAEQYADEQATEEELIIAAQRVVDRLDTMDGDAALAIQLACAALELPDAAVGHTAEAAAEGAAWATSSQAASTGLLVPESQVSLLRDICGNPFEPVRMERSWLKFKVVKLAQAIYDGGAFERMAELGEALEDAGCDDEDILGHLRGPGPHARGCWALDRILTKG